MKVINLTQLGMELAHATDEEQAELFNAFGRYLPMVCKEREDMQLAYMSAHLDKYGIAILKQMGGFADLQEKEPHNLKSF